MTATARFCDGCGTTLTAASPAAAVRKTVTAMFCDLGGSTGFGERVDAETARAVIGRYHALLQEVVDAHDGTVAKFIGDGMLAFFGIPEVAEDDAERAVAAAAAMQRRFAAFADEVEAAHGERLTFRVGVNSGEVVIGDGDADVVGDALNVAARLEKACEPGRVLVGEATWRLTRSSFGFEPLGEVEVTGRAEPVAAYVLAEDERPADEATPFVGRDGELGRLRAVLDSAVAARAARFVTVIGPPGVGKTRLSRELEASVEDGATVLHTACERAGGSTFGPLVDLIRPAIGDTATKEALTALVPPGEPERDRVVDGLAGVVGLGEARSTEETFWALRRLVESLAAEQPLVLVIDDIQWAEARLLDLLEHLAEWVADAPVLLVGLARPELREVRPGLTEPGRRVADVLVLDGLDPAATAQLASEMLGGTGLPPELVARLPDSTDGNPLFVRELVRMLVEEGIIRRDGDDWRLTVDADAVEVPPTIRSLLATRIERLPVAERTVLERASVIGPDFALGALRALIDDDRSIDGHLETLRRRDLVEPTGTYWGEEPVWRFHHVLIRDAVYGRLLKEARADLHERVGDWTAGAAPLVVGEHETAIAHHYEQAHSYRSQLGVLDDHGRELGQWAAELLAIAARRSLVQDDLVAASSLATRALACLEGGANNRGELLLLAAEAILASGDLAQAPTVLDDLAALGATDPGLAAWADVYRAQWLDLTDPTRLDEVERLADDATERFAEAGDGSGQAKAHLVGASVLARRGRLADSEVELDRAMGAAREAHDRRRLVAALGAAPAVALWGPSPVARAGGRCLDVIRLLRITTQSPVVEATSLRHQAVLEALRGRFGPARKLLTDVRSTVEDLGLRRDLMEVELFEGLVDLLDGDPAAAEGHLRTAHEGLAALGAAAAGGAGALLARALLAQGRVEDAGALAEVAGSTSGQDLKAAIAWGSVTAEVRAARGDADGAVAAAEEAVALAEGTDLVLDHADALAALARVRRATGDPTGAEAAEAGARRRYEAKGSTVHGGAAAAPPSESTPATTSGNAAARLNRELNDRWQVEGPDAVADLFSTSYRSIDRRRGLGGEIRGREAAVEQLRVLADLLEGARMAVDEVVAERGDRLALVRTGIHAGFEVELLVLVELDADGRHVLSILYDVDDLDAAMAELDARHQAVSPENLAARVTRELTARWLAEGPDAVLDQYVPDCRLVDRRRGLGSELVGREGLRAQLQAVLDLIGEDGRLVLREVVAQRGEHLAVLRQGVEADGYEVEMLSLVEVDADGRQVASTLYDLDQLPDAMGDLEAWHQAMTPELSAGGTPLAENLAASTHRALVEWVLSEGKDGARVRYHPDAELVDHRLGLGAVVSGPEAMAAHLGTMRTLLEGLEVEPRVDVVAQRGDHLVLLRQGVSGEIDVEGLALIEVDDTGRYRHIEWFDVGDLAVALAALDRRHAELAGNRAARLNVVLIERFVEDGADEVVDLIAEDIHVEDRRIGLQAVTDGREAHLANLGGTDGLWGESRFATPGLLACRGEHLVLSRQLIVGDAEVEMLTVTEFDAADRMCLLLIFDPDDLEAAVAELDRRHAELSNGGPAPVDNRASRLNLVLIDRWMDEGVDAVVDLIAENVHFEDRRSGLGTVIDGREAHLANMRAVDELRGAAHFQHPEVVAVRGEHLVLARQAVLGEVEVQLLGLAQFDVEDRMGLAIMFDPDDLGAALAELDRRFAAGEGAAFAEEILVSSAFGQAVARGDAEALAPLLADGFVCPDHRSIGWGEADRASVLAAVSARLDTLGVGVAVSAELQVHVGLVLAPFEIRTETSTGSEIQQVGISVTEIRGGQIVRLELFDQADRTQAEARFDDLSGSGSAAEPEPLVVRQFRRHLSFLNAGEVQAAEELVARNNVTEDRRRGMREVTVGRAARLVAGRALHETLGGATFGIGEVVDHRGEHLALVRLDTVGALGPTVQSYAIIQGNADGLATGLVVFDLEALDEARVELDRRVPANRAETFWCTLNERWMAASAEAIVDFVADDVWFEDHRVGLRTSLEGRDAFLTQLRTIDDLLPVDARVITGEVIAHRGDNLVLSTHTMPLVGVEMLNLSEFDDDGRAALSAVFDPDDLAGAAEALDRRYAEAEGEAFAAEVTVTAVGGQAIAAGDADALAAVLTDDFVCVDHRPIGWGERDRETFLAAVAARPDTLGRGVWIGREMRPRPGLVFTTYEIRTDADIEEVGVSVATMRGDRFDRLEVFAEDDRAAAEARFDELSAPAAQENPAARGYREFVRLWMSEGAEAVRPVLAEGYRFVDHRLGMGSAIEGIDAIVANLRNIEELLEGEEFRVFSVPAERGERLALIDRGVDSERATVRDLSVVEVDHEGRLLSVDLYDTDDLEAAVDELDRRFAEGEGAPFAGEVAVCAAAWKAIAAGDAGALDPLLADDFSLVDHLPLRGWLGEIDRTAYLRSIAARAADLGVGIGFPRTYLRLTPGSVLVDYELSLRRSADGFESTECGLVVATIRDGRFTRVEVLAEEDRQQAEARFEELPGSNPGPGIANAATRRLAPYTDRFARRDWAWLRELCDEHIRNDDRRSGVNSGVSVGRDRLLELTDALADSGFTTMHQVPVAVRGEELVLFLRAWEHDDGFELALLALMEVDAAGRLVANTMWELGDRASALDELDRRHRELEGAAYPTVLGAMHAFSQAFARRDWDAIPELVSPSFRAVDHRPMGHGEIGFAERFERDRALADLLPDALTYIASAHCSARVGLLRGGWSSVAPDGPGFESVSLLVLVVDDAGRMQRLEFFAEDDADRARACFDELVAVHG